MFSISKCLFILINVDLYAASSIKARRHYNLRRRGKLALTHLDTYGIVDFCSSAADGSESNLTGPALPDQER